MKKKKRTLYVCIFVITIVLFLLLPVALYFLLSSKDFTVFIRTLEITHSDFIDSVINYFSLSLTILLGIAVYFQSQRINDLEMTQYDAFIGIEAIDNSTDYGDKMFSSANQRDFWMSYNFSPEKRVIMAGIMPSVKPCVKPIVLTLKFITRNQPLIVSLQFDSISVKLMQQNTLLFHHTYKCKTKPINTILPNDSHFWFCFGMHLPQSWEIDAIALDFTIEIQTQNGTTYKLMPTVTLASFEGGFLVASSKTITI